MQTTNNGPDSSSAGTTPPPLQQPTPPPPQQHWQNQQQWMAAMQYPMAVMQQLHMMMYPHQYAPYTQGHYQHPPQFHYVPYHQQQQRGGSGGDDVKTLWVGDLLHWMDETYLHTCFSHTNEVSSVKVIRNKQTNQSEGYGFVEFLSRSAAEEVLQSYSGVTMPNADQPFRLN
ncbi:unnamed protein product [Brassica oleracea]|uniref:RRM domain-containing protein n=1 Tax=Brassica oleracea TaxID=3712 RepID=A0A3P6FLW8_BRAOL|nr:unnamed protein product [Brassica oleracea]